MLTAHWKAHLLPLLLLSLHSLSVCLAAGLADDDNMRKVQERKIATVKVQPTGKNWEPLRIVASTKDLEVSSKYCTKDHTFYERASQGTDSDCRVISSTFAEEEKTIATGILKRAIALRTDRLLVQRVTGPLVIPKVFKIENCNLLNVPEEHHTKGVANADMVLYVGSIRDSTTHGGAQSFGKTCAKSTDGRPIAGALFFGSIKFEISRHTVRLTAHHIAHALGFSYDEMKSCNMITEKIVDAKTPSIAVVKSEKTKQMTKAHYGCTEAKGMELEDSEEVVQNFPHWKQRNAKDELMADPIMGLRTSFMDFYTSLTLASFEYTGYYKANFEMAEHMEYGNNKGCDFLNGKCKENGKTKWPNMLCAYPQSYGSTEVCTTDRLGFGICAARKIVRPSRLYPVQYFASAQQGVSELSVTDSCLVVQQDPSSLCTDTEETETMPRSLVGKNLVCLDGDALKEKKNNETVTVSGVCVEILCEGGSVKVKYLGATDKWHDCPEGQSITPSSTSASFESGKIKCPKYKEVCTVASDGSSLVPKKVIHKPIETSTTTSTSAPQGDAESQEPTAPPNNSTSSGKSKDSSQVPFGLIPCVAFFVFSFAGFLIV